MSLDCYCALCSGPLGIVHVKFGSKKKKDLAKRNKRVENKKRRLAGEKVVHEDSKEWKEAEREGETGHGDEDGDVEMSDANQRSVERSGEDGDGGDIEGGGSENGSNNDNAEEQEWENEESEHDSNESNGSRVEDDDGSEHDSSPSDFDDSASDNWSTASELLDLSTLSKIRMYHDDHDDTDSMYSWYEKNSYDPETLKRQDAQWTDRCRVLGLNKNLDGAKRAFISGRGRYEDLFDFKIKKSGSDPRDPVLSSHPVYHCYEPDAEIATFPFHEECFKLLTRCLGHQHRKEVDKDVLYAVMIQNVLEFGNRLQFEYGNVEGAEQFWESYAGMEWSVADPGPKLGIDEVVKSMLPAALFDRPHHTPPLDLGHKVKSDPLAVLPYDILHGIFAELPLKDTLSLVIASLHVFDSTHDPSFWRHMIRVHIVPFFHELSDFLKNSTFPDSFDWKGAFQWLDKITKPSYGMQGSLMAIANRRRIWNVCEQIAPLYHEKMNAEKYREPADNEAASILDKAETYHMPVTMFPQPAAEDTRAITAQFIRSWSEIGYRACDLETYWTDGCGTLVGMSVMFGSVQRLFGKAEGVKGNGLHIKAGEWIKEMKVHVGNINPRYQDRKEGEERKRREDPRAVTGSQIQGVTVRRTSFKRL
jgi:hypothetical protein